MEWSAKSKRDMRGLYIWIYERNRRAADRVHGAIEGTAELFKDTPKIGIETAERGVLKLPVPNTEYTIFYKITGESIVIIRVLKQSQEVPEIMNEDDYGFLI